MGIKKLIKDLQHQLSKGEKKGHVPLDRIDDLLAELKKKEKKLEHKLADEDSSSKRKHLKLELKIARLQLKKGKARRAQIAKGSK